MEIKTIKQLCLIVFMLMAPTPLTAAQAEPPAAVLEAEQQRIEVMKRAAATTVAVFDAGGQGGGSGVLISADGFALTNFHVTAPCGTAMKCGLNDGKMYDGVIVGVDPVGDVALIQLLGRDDFPFAELGDSDRVAVGDWVFTAGNPFLLADNLQPSIAYGMISGTHRYQYPGGTLLEYADCLQTDAAINPGNSGGPLFAADGKLIGINGRGSFEKRKRVNVGVGYAISINQIKNFLGHLKSGRIVDHATLGATVSTSDNGEVTVDEILDNSDAFRRGLRYGDQIVSFAGREITTANRLKNALGIFPRDWPAKLTYRREGRSFDTTVRLMGVHDRSQLLDLVQKKEQQPTEPPQGDKPEPEGEKKLPKQLEKIAKALKKKSKLPQAVEERFIARRGYANYWYNEQKQQQLWEGFASPEILAKAGHDWRIEGNEGAVVIEVVANQARVQLPTAVSSARFTDDLATQRSPPNSGGLLVTLHVWQRLIHKGLRQFGEVYYLGQLPRRVNGESVDCLIGIYAGLETCFQFDIATGDLVGIVMLPREGVDPCELYLSDYGDVSGIRLPRQWRVFHGERQFLELTVDDWQFKARKSGGPN